MVTKLWGSRFPKKLDNSVLSFTSSISYDKRLAKYDVLGSITHAKMLQKQKIIPKKDALKIIKGLKEILKDIEKNNFKFSTSMEDIHTQIQDALFKKIGSAANKLHTARSRNDQVVLDVKLYLKDELTNILELIKNLQKEILKFAYNNYNIIILGYTHLQPAQCVSIAHYLLAYIEALERDKSRLNDAYKRLDEMPLGSCALSGTSLPIDREFLRRELKFKKITRNSIDSVSDRDFIIEVLSNISILGIHLSRFAEDLILWSTKEFDFIDIDFSFCTGSSIMPHKKNPDVLELIRGLSSNLNSNLLNVLTLMKGLPLSYNRDLQLDKLPLFNSIDTIKEILKIFAKLFTKIKIKTTSIANKLQDESLFSVDIVEHLIKKGLSYREAHDIVGRLIRDCLDKNKKISELKDKDLKKYSNKLSILEIKPILNAWESVNKKTSYGGTAIEQVKKQLNYYKRRLNA